MQNVGQTKEKGKQNELRIEDNMPRDEGAVGAQEPMRIVRQPTEHFVDRDTDTPHRTQGKETRQ